MKATGRTIMVLSELWVYALKKDTDNSYEKSVFFFVFLLLIFGYLWYNRGRQIRRMG
jgi:UDP-N-acetylmuramyl pentapeptide phosphotransferase/UDP-N-acetylglucosamine-1-phosphate transferase